jgi:hypothetical protein
MRRLPWTKFQDFYLRLGFLKVLVAVLNPQRRSEVNDTIIRKLEKPLFDVVWKHSALWSRVSEHFPAGEYNAPNTPHDKKKKTPVVAEALLIDGECASYLFATTGPTAYKIVDWGRNIEFVGRGNQITERGLLLRHLLDDRAVEKFNSGDVESWNPFILNSGERCFFLYHLAEIDRVTLELTRELGRLEVGSVLESKDAAVMTSRTLIEVLGAAKDSVQPRDILAFRRASELASTIANEVGHDELAVQLIGRTRPRPPKPIRPTARRQLTKSSRTQPRRASKNADHQTVPRFEQLVDLGFLDKPALENEGDGTDAMNGRKRWRYRTTEACSRWATILDQSKDEKKPFLWYGFAQACLAFKGVVVAKECIRPEVVAHYLNRAYELARRAAGYDPLDSIALVAMIMAIEDGVRLEMADCHRLMLAIKQGSLLPNHAYFASGNDLDRMFILLKPGFAEQVGKLGEQLFVAERESEHF